MFLRLSLVLLLIGAVLGGIYWMKLRQQQEQAGMAGPPAPPVVAVEAVRLEQWQPRLTAAGSLVAIQGIFVTNEVSGQVREISFESGQQQGLRHTGFRARGSAA